MKRNYKLVGIDCAHCAAKMEEGIKKLDGVNAATVNFMTTKLILDFDEAKAEEVLAGVEKVVHKVDDNVVVKRV